jgi:glycine hydroxymethyltransferase
MSNDEEIGQKLNKAVFPGLQGGPLMHIIAAKAVAFKEALTEDYRSYIDQVLLNAKMLGKTLVERGYDILTGGTVNHIVLLDLRKHGLTGKLASESLDRAGITSNKNTVPFDHTSPFITSGVRLGTPACTTRGFKENDFKAVGNLIADVLDGLKQFENNSKIEKEVYVKVTEITKKFPIYQ